MSDIVSRTISVHQEHEFLKKLEVAGLTSYLAQTVIESKDNALAREVVGLIAANPIRYSVAINYDLSVEELIESGDYDCVHKHISSENFPSRETGEAELVILLLNFAERVSSERVFEQMKMQGLGPATVKELLALNNQHSGVLEELLKDFGIVALGSAWRSSRNILYAPSLYHYVEDTRRGLDLIAFEGDWHPSWLFACVRRSF